MIIDSARMANPSRNLNLTDSEQVKAQEQKSQLGEKNRDGMWDSLKHRDYRYLWVGNLCSSFAMNMQMVARGWLVYAMTTSPTKLAWVMLSFMIPQVLFSLFGGIFADRYNKKKVIAIAQGLNCAATLVLAVVIITGHVTFWDFIYFGAFNGTILALSMPARTSFIPEIVGERLVFNAMALSTTSMNLSRILGPTVAGGMIAIIAGGDTSSAYGVGVVYFLIAGLYFLSSVSTLMIGITGKPAIKKTTNPLADVAEAWRYVLASRVLLGLIVLSIIPFLFGMSINSLMPAFNHDILEGGPDGLGLLMGAMGIGAIAGSLLLARMGNTPRKGRLLFIITILWAVFMAIFAITRNMILAMLAVAVVGFFSSIFMSLIRSLIQLAVTPSMRGRVMSIDMMSHGLMPLGIIPISLIAEYYSIDLALLVSAVLLAACALFVMYFLPEVRKIDRGFDIHPDT